MDTTLGKYTVTLSPLPLVPGSDVLLAHPGTYADRVRKAATDAGHAPVGPVHLDSVTPLPHGSAPGSPSNRGSATFHVAVLDVD